MQVFSKTKKKVFTRGNANFQGKVKKLMAMDHFQHLMSSAESREFSRTCRLQGQGFNLRGQSQGLQNVSSRTPPLLFGILGGRFLTQKLLSKCGFFPDHTTVIRELLFLISKKIFAIFARIHSEQGGFLKISFVSYITGTLTYSV